MHIYKTRFWYITCLPHWKPLSILSTKSKLHHVFPVNHFRSNIKWVVKNLFSLIQLFGHLSCYLRQNYVSYLSLKESIAQKFSYLFVSAAFPIEYSKFYLARSFSWNFWYLKLYILLLLKNLFPIFFRTAWLFVQNFLHIFLFNTVAVRIGRSMVSQSLSSNMLGLSQLANPVNPLFLK